MFSRAEAARIRYNEFVNHYNDVISDRATGCPYGCPYPDESRNIQWHKNYLARLNCEYNAAVAAERAEARAEEAREARWLREERRREERCRREEERRREEAHRVKKAEYEKKRKQVDQLQAQVTQKQQLVEQHQQTCKRLTPSLAAKKNELEITLKNLGSEREALKQEQENCVRLIQEQQSIQDQIQKLSTSLATHEGLYFLHRGECLQENPYRQIERDQEHLVGYLAQHDVTAMTDIALGETSTLPVPEVLSFLHTGECSQKNVHPQHDGILECAVKHVMEHAIAHAAGHIVQYGVTAIAKKAFESTVATAIGTVAGGLVGSLFIVETLNENERMPFRFDLGDEERKTIIDNLRQDRDQLLEQQREKRTEFESKKAIVCTLEEQCTTLGKSAAQMEQQIKSISQQKRAEQHKINDLNNQKVQLQKKLGKEGTQLEDLEEQVNSFHL
jgi:hypothetical protein